MARKPGTSLGLSIFLIVALLVLLTAAGAVVAALMGRDLARDTVVGELRRVNAAQAVLRQSRFRYLERVSRELSIAPWVAAGLSGDGDALRAPLDEARREYGLDLLVLVDREGRPLAGAREDGLADASLLGALRDGQQRKSVAGVWRLGDTLHHAVIARVVRDFELLGFVGVGASIAPLADELKRATGAEILLLGDSPTGPTAVASSLGDERAEAVIAALRREGQALARVQRGETVEAADLELDGEPWLAFLAPLRDAAEQPVGATVGLTSLAGRLDVFERILLLLAVATGAALAIGLALSLFLGNRVLAPVQRLAGAIGNIATGRDDVELPPPRGPFAPLIAPLHALARRLSDQRSLETYLEQVGRELPEPARHAATSPPRTRQLALVAVEMRRFANPKLGYDPEENVGRLARDLRRISAAASARQGTVETIHGHRILAVFEGEEHAVRALTAATEILLILTTRENAFDEPVPPVIVLTQGSVVTGSVRWGARTDGAVAGLPVQQLESLMREATPGEIYMSKAFAEEVAPTLRQAGVELNAQRGLMSPQPLYPLDAETARRVTGAQPPPAEPRGVSQVLTLADLVPGEVLGRRFEILAELGGGPAGAVFKCRDRDRGDLVRLKVLSAATTVEPARVDHLRRTLDALRMIRHSNVLDVLDFGQIDGLAFIASSFVRAVPLRFIVDRGPVPVAPAFLIARQIAEGLRAAHGQNLAHGGLKPENVLVGPTGGVKVTDFGFGGPAADPRDDLHDWGIVFYEMLTGIAPAAGAIEPPSARVADLPPRLEAVLLRCLKTRPEARPASFAELVRDLDALRA